MCHSSLWRQEELIMYHGWLPEYLIWVGIGVAWLDCVFFSFSAVLRLSFVSGCSSFQCSKTSRLFDVEAIPSRRVGGSANSRQSWHSWTSHKVKVAKFCRLVALRLKDAHTLCVCVRVCVSLSYTTGGGCEGQCDFLSGLLSVLAATYWSVLNQGRESALVCTERERERDGERMSEREKVG